MQFEREAKDFLKLLIQKNKFTIIFDTGHTNAPLLASSEFINSQGRKDLIGLYI